MLPAIKESFVARYVKDGREPPWWFPFYAVIALIWALITHPNRTLRAVAHFVLLFPVAITFLVTTMSQESYVALKLHYKQLEPDTIIRTETRTVIKYRDRTVILKNPAPRPVGTSTTTAAFVAKYARLARQIEREYGIPASITLAQAVVESRSGTSALSKYNNFFGIKCFERGCPKGHCVNYADDTRHDRFRVFKTPRECFMYRVEFLRKGRDKGRYAKCFRSKDYSHWAYALKEAGYATDRNYPQALIGTIRKNGLDRYDLN